MLSNWCFLDVAALTEFDLGVVQGPSKLTPIAAFDSDGASQDFGLTIAVHKYWSGYFYVELECWNRSFGVGHQNNFVGLKTARNCEPVAFCNYKLHVQFFPAERNIFERCYIG
jgi:hypothetical protein